MLTGQTSRSIEVPAGIVVSSADSPMYFPPTWLADGSGFATWKAGDAGAFGRLGLDGSHTRTAIRPRSSSQPDASGAGRPTALS